MRIVLAFGLMVTLIAVITFVAADMYSEEIGDLYTYIHQRIEKAK